jgi:ketosteroid isomerase-like protein
MGNEPARWEIRPLELSRRGLDEWLVMRAPALVRAINRAILRRRPGSRLRRAALTRSVRRSFAAGNRHDWEVQLPVLRTDVEMRLTPDVERLVPGLEPVYRGHEGYLKAQEEWHAAFEDFRFDPREIVDAGDRVAVLSEIGGRGRGSGIELTQEQGLVYEFEQGMVARMHVFWTWEETVAKLRHP